MFPVMAALQRTGNIPLKNTFIHFDEPSTPVPPPTLSAPGRMREPEQPQLVEAAAAPTQPPAARGRRRDVFRRLFGTQRGGRAAEDKQMPAGAGATSSAKVPVEVQSENTSVVHVEESSQSFLSSVPSSVTSAPSAELGTQAALGSVELSNVMTCQRACMPSLGSEGHCAGQCIPCLMQVRWQAGRCAEPCKFGALCGRCHEAHTEEELQRIQARMRKQKKKHGEQAAALLSSAYANGNVAPVGTGAASARKV